MFRHEIRASVGLLEKAHPTYFEGASDVFAKVPFSTKSISLKYESHLGTAAHCCEVVVLKLRTSPYSLRPIHFRAKREQLKKNFYLKFKVTIWPWLSYMCHIRPTAASRGLLVFKAHRPLHRSTLGVRVIKKKKAARDGALASKAHLTSTRERERERERERAGWKGV